ncbi:MAG: hypothetical protein Q8M44_00660, partial [bacterium]|nr:hypothetical protein [bacterium]
MSTGYLHTGINSFSLEEKEATLLIFPSPLRRGARGEVDYDESGAVTVSIDSKLQEYAQETLNKTLASL